VLDFKGGVMVDGESWKGLLLAGATGIHNDLHKDNIGALREIGKARMPTITKQTLKYELGVSRIWTLTNSHKAYR